METKIFNVITEFEGDETTINLGISCDGIKISNEAHGSVYISHEDFEAVYKKVYEYKKALANWEAANE